MDHTFTSSVNDIKKRARASIAMVVKESIGNITAENYKDLVEFEPLLSNGAYKFSISTCRHLDEFPQNLGDEQGERYLHDIKMLYAKKFSMNTSVLITDTY